MKRNPTRFRFASFVAALVLVAAGVGVGHAVASGSSQEARTQRARNLSGGTIVSGGALLQRKSPLTPVLQLPGLGTLLARCGSGGRATTQLTLLRSTATATVVVLADGGQVVASLNRPVNGPNPGGPAGLQVWQVGPISEAQVTVATIWVGMQPDPPSDGCAVSAQAVLGRTKGSGP